MFDTFTLAMGGRSAETLARAEELIEFATEHQLTDFLLADVVREWAEAMEAGESAPARFRGRDLTPPRPTAFRIWKPFLLGFMAQTAVQVGRPGEALQALDSADREAHGANAHFYDAELLRVRAEALAGMHPERTGEAIGLLAEARAVALRQGAGLFAARAHCAGRRLTGG